MDVKRRLLIALVLAPIVLVLLKIGAIEYEYCRNANDPNLFRQYGVE